MNWGNSRVKPVDTRQIVGKTVFGQAMERWASRRAWLPVPVVAHYKGYPVTLATLGCRGVAFFIVCGLDGGDGHDDGQRA